jgi:hypothetical protein
MILVGWDSFKVCWTDGFERAYSLPPLLYTPFAGWNFCEITINFQWSFTKKIDYGRTLKLHAPNRVMIVFVCVSTTLISYWVRYLIILWRELLCNHIGRGIPPSHCSLLGNAPSSLWVADLWGYCGATTLVIWQNHESSWKATFCLASCLNISLACMICDDEWLCHLESSMKVQRQRTLRRPPLFLQS